MKNEAMLTPLEARRASAKLTGYLVNSRVNDAGEWLVEVVGQLTLPGGRGKQTIVQALRGPDVLRAVNTAMCQVRNAYEPTSHEAPTPKAG